MYFASSANAGTDIWQGGTNTWAAGYIPAWTAGDTAEFNGVGTVTNVVNLGATQVATGIIVTSAQTGNTLLEGGGAAEILDLDAGGISMAAGSGAFTIGSTTAVQNVVTDLTSSQSWTNNSSSLLQTVNGITNAATTTPLTLTINGSGSGGTTLSGVISNGSGTSTTALTINTTGGTTTLSSANTFTGGFTLNSGTVKTQSANTLGSNATPINLNGGVLDLENPANGSNDPIGVYNTVVGGNVTIKSGSSGTTGLAYLLGTLSIGADTLTADKGSNVVSGQRVQFASTTLTGNATLDSENGTLLVVGAGGTSAGLAGNFNLTVQSADGTGVTSVRGGTGGSSRTAGTTFFNSGVNAINGSGGTAILGSTGTNLVLNGGSLDLQNTSISIAAYSTTVGGNFTLTSDGSNGTVVNILGPLSIGSFTLTTGSTNSQATGEGNIGFGATTLTGNPTFNVTNTTTGTGAQTATLTLGALNDGGTARTITKSGPSTLIIGSATTNLTANDQFNVSAGTLSSTNATALGTAAGSGVTVDVADGAVFNVGASQTIGALTNTTGNHTANTGSVTLNAFTLTIGSTANQSGTFGGVISGTTGGIVKAGNGMEILSGVNTYTGTTRVTGGTLLINGSTAAGSAVSASGAGAIGGNGTINGTLTLVSGTTLTPGPAGANSVGTLSTGALSLNSNANLVFDLGTTSDLVAVTGNLTLGGLLTVNAQAGFGTGQYELFTYTGTLDNTTNTTTVSSAGGFSATIDTSTSGIVFLDVTAVPEPRTTWLLIGAGGLILGCRLRTRRVG